jgi:hypothetical protein
MIDQFPYFYNVTVVELYLKFQGLLQIGLKRLSIIYLLQRHKLNQGYVFTNFTYYFFKLHIQTKSHKENQNENIEVYNQKTSLKEEYQYANLKNRTEKVV